MKIQYNLQKNLVYNKKPKLGKKILHNVQLQVSHLWALISDFSLVDLLIDSSLINEQIHCFFTKVQSLPKVLEHLQYFFVHCLINTPSPPQNNVGLWKI